MKRVIVLIVILLIAASDLSAAPVKSYNGHLYRSWEYARFVMTKCNYPAEHEAVLTKAMDKVWKEYKGYQIYNMLLLKKAANGNNIACGESADAMRDFIKPLLPEGWKTYSINSVDVTNLYGGTGHTIFAIEAPDGTVYAGDAYFMYPELTRMKKVHEYGMDYLVPDEVPHLWIWTSCVSWITGNPFCKWENAEVKPEPLTNQEIQNMILHQNNQQGQLQPQAQVDITVATSWDPNDIYGPTGVGDLRYIPNDIPLNYTIAFENLPAATLPAAKVVVTNQIDSSKYDLDTFSFGKIDFGSHVLTPDSGLTNYTADVDLRPGKNLIVRVTAVLNKNTSTAVWIFESLDPDTMQEPVNSNEGFLPPNKTSPEGEGHVSYTCLMVDDLQTGDTLTNKASIVFDFNAPINTPEWTNVIDATKPASSIDALDAVQDLSTFRISLKGSDGQSGISGYDIYCSTNGGEYVLIASSSSDEGINFTGEKGKNYAFYSVAHDGVGNIEDKPNNADTITKVSETADTIDIVSGTMELVDSVEVEPGIWDFKYKLPLQNLSSIAITNAKASLNNVSSAITIKDADIVYGTIAKNAVSSPDDTIGVRIDFSKPNFISSNTTWTFTFDAIGKSQSISMKINMPVVSKLSPKPVITLPTTSPTYTTILKSIDIGGTVAANAKSVVWTNLRTKKKGTCRKVKENWSAKKIILLPGNNEITIKATQKNKSIDSTSIIVTYNDETPPIVKIKSPSSKSVFSTVKKSITIGGSATDNEAVSKVTWINETTNVSGTCTGTKSWKTANIALKLDDNVIIITAQDSSSNTASATITITLLDKTKPKISITAPTSKPSIKVNKDMIDISGKASDDNAIADVKWSNSRGGSGTCAGTDSWSASGIVLKTEVNKITVTATDIKGNSSKDILTVTYKP